MKLYLIGGLGADERVFRYLDIKNETQVIKWINPKSKEELKHYANRLLEQINQNEDFGLLGVSFGGIVAIELAKLAHPQKLILISSVETIPNYQKRIWRLGKHKY